MGSHSDRDSDNDVEGESFHAFPSAEALSSVYSFNLAVKDVMPCVPDWLSKGLALITDGIETVYLINERMEKQVRSSVVISKKKRKARVNALEKIIATEYLDEGISKNVSGRSENEMVRIETATKGVNQLISITKESATELKDIVLGTVGIGALGRIVALSNKTKQRIGVAAEKLNAIAHGLIKKEEDEKEQAKQAAIKAQGDKLEQEITGLKQEITELKQEMKQEMTKLSEMLAKFLEMQQNKENK
jgi:hypothetical protein